MERSLGVTVGALVAGQVPDDQRLVARTGQEHIRVLEGGRKGGDPARVALKGALENELFGHLVGVARSICDEGFEQEFRNKCAIWKGYKRDRLGSV